MMTGMRKTVWEGKESKKESKKDGEKDENDDLRRGRKVKRRRG